MRIRAISGACCLLSLLVSGVAYAQSAGFAVEQFDPAPAGDRFFAVRDPFVRGLLDLHGALVTSYAYQPLRRYRVQAGSEFVTRQLYAHANVSAAIAYAFMLNLDVPLVVAQGGDGGFARSPRSVSFADTRLALRMNLTGLPEASFGLGAEVDVWFPTGSSEDFTGDTAARAEPKLVLSGRSRDFVYGFDAGFSFRPDVTFGPSRVGRALTFGGAAGIEVADDSLFLGLESTASTATGAFFDANATPWEALADVKLRMHDVVAGIAFGSAPLHPLETFRAVVSLTWSADRRVTDHDGDGLPDKRDACPSVPGEGADGCPLPDRDGDSITDAADACPSEPGLVHVDPKKNGCPP
jgi:hypothetical protein